MLSGTNILAHRARVSFIKLNTAAKCIIVSPGTRYCSTPGAVVAAAAAVAPAAAAAAAANLSAIQPPQLELSFAGRLGVHASDGRIQLKNLTFEELEEWCQSMGHDSRKALLLWKAMYQDGRWMRDTSEDDAQLDASTTQAAAAAASGGGGVGVVLRGSAGLQLSAALKATVQQHASLDGGLTLQSVTTARDGTHKLIFALHGGPTNGSVETVLIPMRDRAGTRLRYTACLSSQVGCAMNCQFCYTGRMGLLGNLTTAQIVEQLVEARRWLAHYTAQQQQQQEQQELQQQPQQHSQQQQQWQDGASGVVQQAGLQQEDSTSSTSSSRRARGKGSNWPTQPPRINNIVFMGMGEPLHCPSVWPALDILCHPQGLALSRSKVIVSTVGLLPQLRELRASGKAKLAVSLHATTDEVRDWIVPTNRRYPLAELISTLQELYPLPAKATPPSQQPSATDAGTNSSSAASSSSDSDSSSKKRRSQSDDFVVIEYVLLKDVNDTDADAHRLLELLSEVYCMINLIVFNPHEGTAFQRSDEQQARRFREIVQAGGKVCTLRISKGDDEMAACGQLGGASMNLATRPAPLLQPPEKLRESLTGAAAAVSALRQQRHVAGTGAARQLLLKRQRQLNPAVVPRV